MSAQQRNDPDVVAGVSWQLRRSARRSVAIHIRRDGHVEVRAPLRYPLAAIEVFVRSRQAWIATQLARLQTLPAVPSWGDGRQWWHQGQAWPVRIEPLNLDRQSSSRPRTQVRFNEAGLISTGFCISTHAAPEEWPDVITKALQRWQAEHAKHYLPVRVDALVTRLGEQWRPSALRFRCLRARWGSCSADGRIMLNTQLMQLPEHLIDYVICHEMAHLREMNHSAAFYAVQQALNPQWQAQRAEMKPWARRLASAS